MSAASVTLRFNNATKTYEKVVTGRLTPKKIDAYGRWFDRATGKPTDNSRSGVTYVRVISYQEPGREPVTFS